MSEFQINCQCKESEKSFMLESLYHAGLYTVALQPEIDAAQPIFINLTWLLTVTSVQAKSA